MPEHHDERRLREAAVTRALGVPPEPDPVRDAEDEAEDGARARIDQQTLWVDRQVQAAIDRGDFDNLPGAGKPLRLPAQHDPDWWVKGLVERERITAVLPPAIALRTEDAGLDGEIDRLASAAEVRVHVEDFNRRVVEARRQLTGGPPVITPTRDVESEVEAWRERRAARRRHPDSSAEASPPAAGRPRTNRGWRGWRRRGPR